ncbi:MAG: TRAP transporter large permease [Thermanaeromonas sp.]|uniref:TRAP transporter large permease n=1 Tax=Thermanaeromonas sp. TaxID=2003697 RepID=UPI002437C18C|nr:TRAP transporter large permease [Thermanaeromonas sp.]MCG0278509.1 TRAP transporter large permease [Thermanaeromonas sp.]
MWMVPALFVVSLAIGVPIAFVLGASGVVHALLMQDPYLLTMLPQRMFAAVDNFSLMAIPLFVLAGELMGFGGVTEKLAEFTRAVIGHIRGGLAYVTVIVGCFLGALLGSANAEAALLGRVLQPEMKKDGYGEIFSTCLTAAVSILGPIIPPSMVLIVYGVAANLSIGELFFAGIIPGLLLGITYMVLIWFYGRKESWPVRQRASLAEVGRTFLGAAPSLLVPVIILGGILGGITTPTESAAAASVVAVFLGTVVYRKLKLADIPKILERTGIVSASIMIIVAMANILGWTMALDRVPQAIAEFMLSLTTNKYLVLLLMNILLFFVGMVMETIAAIIILVPVFLPIISALGIDPLHFGLVVSLNLVIGLMTPPVGVALFTTSIVTGTPLERLVKPIWVWVGAAVIVLMALTYMPGLVTWLPRIIFKH